MTLAQEGSWEYGLPWLDSEMAECTDGAAAYLCEKPTYKGERCRVVLCIQVEVCQASFYSLPKECALFCACPLNLLFAHLQLQGSQVQLSSTYGVANSPYLLIGGVKHAAEGRPARKVTGLRPRDLVLAAHLPARDLSLGPLRWLR